MLQPRHYASQAFGYLRSRLESNQGEGWQRFGEWCRGNVSRQFSSCWKTEGGGEIRDWGLLAGRDGRGWEGTGLRGEVH